MTVWIIEPREPVIMRDGRPFNQQPGVMAATLPFPFPMTTAGAARSRAGSSKDGVFDVAERDLPILKEIQVRGPLLAEFDRNTETWKLLVPAPGDALLLEGDKPLHCQQLVPLCAGSQYSPFRLDTPLAPVGPEIYEPEKPAKNPPAFWRWQKFHEWLLHPKQMCGPVTRDELGIQALPQEERVHVALVPGMMVAREGALFETRGLEFTSRSEDASKLTGKLAGARRLALWLDVEEHKEYRIEAGMDSLGGERRLVSWQTCKQSDLSVPTCPKELCEDIVQAGACRLILLTPAYFQNGYLPDVSQWESAGVKLQLCAALVGRPHVVSGWDIKQHGPKPTQRLAPAGSVFFLKFTNQPDATAIHAWIEQTWMKCLSEGKQNKSDGFGLAVLGSWDGKRKQMRDKERNDE